MKRTTNIFCTFVLIALLTIPNVTGFKLQVNAYSEQGQCGDDVHFSIKNDILTIYGNGATYDYDYVYGPGNYEYEGPNVTGHGKENGEEYYYRSIPWQTNDEDGNKTNPIKHVIVQEGITSLGQNMFHDLENMVDISLPSSLEEIGHGCFYGCSGLEKIEFPARLKILGSGYEYFRFAMFEYCSSLKEVIIPENSQLEYIEKGAFFEAGVYDGITMFIPSKCTTICERAFNGFFSSFEVDPQNMYYTSKDGILYSKDMSQLIQFPVCSKVRAFQIPDSVTEIGGGAFRCLGLGLYDFTNSSVVGNYFALFIPNSVEKMGKDAIVTEIPTKIYFEGNKTKYDTFVTVGDENAISVASSELTVYNASRKDFSKETKSISGINDYSNNTFLVISIIFVLLSLTAIVLIAVLIRKKKVKNK